MITHTRRRIAAAATTTTFRRSINHFNYHHHLHPRKRRHYHAATILSSNNNVNLDLDLDGEQRHEQHHPLTNGGTVVGVWIFHRHGDRVPNRYLGAPSYLRRETKHWYGRIPSRGGDSALGDDLSNFFPPEIHGSQNGGLYLDLNREPFGFLTHEGVDQMRNVGSRFRRRYERFGHRAGGGRTEGRTPRQYSILDHWDVSAYSTNYLRTVMSVQCFLDGLIGKSPNIDDGNETKRDFKDVGRHEHSSIAMSTWTTAKEMKDQNSIRVQVRDKQIDTLNAFDKYPQMMDGLVKDVIATEQFQRIDGAAKTLAETLSSYLPGLLAAPQAFGGTPSGVNWIHANDHFVCRRAHSVPLLAFSDHEGMGREEEALASLANPVRSHLSWRFREWYRCPRLLSAIACPPFREMHESMSMVAAQEDHHGRRPFVLYSCHDVTLLALLYAIGADFLVSGEDDGGADMQEEEAYSNVDGAGCASGRNARTQQKSWRWWPAYSSTIAFELVRLEEERQLAIRIILNGDVVRTIPRMTLKDEGLLKEQPLSSRQVFGEMRNDSKSHNMMSLSDFEQVNRVLEETGMDMEEGDSISSIEGDKSNEMNRIGVDGG